MALDSLPREILHEILSFGTHNRKDLWNCSLVSHNLWEVATSILYSSIDLRIESQWCDGRWQLQKNPEITLVNTLASNPILGAKVRTLSICFPNPYGGVRDEYMAFGQENGDQAARNISFLTKAALTETGLTHHIIANITAYTQLTELNLRLGPEIHQWGNKPTPVKTLRWVVPTDYSKDGGTIDSWNTAACVLDIVSTVFPEIVELDISNFTRTDSDAAPPSISQGVTDHSQTVSLPRLQSFRYQGGVHGMERELMLDFVQRNHGTLTSLAMALGFEALDQKMMDYVQQIATAASKLKSLTIPNKGRRQRWASHTLPIWSDPTPSLAKPTHGIEFFEMWDIGCSFSPAIGQFFSGWNSLRVLKIGAPLFEKYERDGVPNFDDIAHEIQSFVRGLPQSIEEIYIELDNSQLTCDEDEDFDPIEELSAEIFKSLTRLHTLDINVWIADTDRTTGYIPEKAIFCRRRPSEQDLGNKKKKVVWTSRLECVYQEKYANISNTTTEIEGDFEGKDAEEPWLGGGRSWVSQSSKYWVNGVYILGEDTDPDDSEDVYDEEDD
ncbi:hypothetical protein N431DRAFT_480500 [Stipitochalara longipes BDJ]|nr:hypothetical protein N431DRAFT_480500 [Stipitochalara longipes BDJ]